MKKLVSLFLMAAMVSFVAVSCKKYEEGPTFSLASKKGRVAGTWEIDKATQNGIDVTASFQAFVKSLELTKDGDVTITYADNSTESYKWDFDDKKENIVFTYPDNSTESWEIIRLKQKELWVKITDGSDVMEIQFKQ